MSTNARGAKGADACLTSVPGHAVHPPDMGPVGGDVRPIDCTCGRLPAFVRTRYGFRVACWECRRVVDTTSLVDALGLWTFMAMEVDGPADVCAG